RQLITDNPQIGRVVDGKSAAAFLDGLRLDINQQPAIDLPAIVPPLTFKPLMSREQLSAWSAADVLLQKARIVAVVGYSFAQVDGHFNDLLRKGNPGARVIVLNPDLQGTAERACHALSLDPATLRATDARSRRPGLQTGRLTCVKGRADELSKDDVVALLR